MIIHPLQPTPLNKDSKLLILGSFPSIISRKVGFYYANPTNRFWRILESLFEIKLPVLDSKNIKIYQEFLVKNCLVISDIIYSCEIINSSDATIKNAVIYDIFTLLKVSNIQKIFLNGIAATNLFKKYCKNNGYNVKTMPCDQYNSLILSKDGTLAKIQVFSLPSSSAANARYSLEKLIQSWSIIKL